MGGMGFMGLHGGAVVAGPGAALDAGQGHEGGGLAGEDVGVGGS